MIDFSGRGMIHRSKTLGPKLKVSVVSFQTEIVDVPKVTVKWSTGEAVTGSVLRFTLSGQPLGAPRPGDDNRSLAFALIALALAFGLGVFLFVRVRAVQRAMLNPQAYKQQLVRDIARLDDEHARGKISAAIYTRERERLKSALKDVWR